MALYQDIIDSSSNTIIDNNDNPIQDYVINWVVIDNEINMNVWFNNFYCIDLGTIGVMLDSNGEAITDSDGNWIYLHDQLTIDYNNHLFNIIYRHYGVENNIQYEYDITNDYYKFETIESDITITGYINNILNRYNAIKNDIEYEMTITNIPDINYGYFHILIGKFTEE